jgi:hypothetical protein
MVLGWADCSVGQLLTGPVMGCDGHVLGEPRAGSASFWVGYVLASL